MRKLLNSPWFVAVLALAAVVVVGYKLWFEAKPPAPLQAYEEPPVESAPAESDGTPGLSVAAALRALAIPATVRNPFALPPKTEDTDGDQSATNLVEIIDRVRLSAIWSQGSAVFLLLNDQICQPGDTIAHFTVESADVDGTWVRHTGVRSFLAVGRELVVKTTAPGPIPLSPLSP